MSGNRHFSRDVCNALGLAGKGVSAITLRMSSDGSVVAEVTMVVRNAKPVEEVLRRYQLEAVEIIDTPQDGKPT